jgi:hypothetical protein
MGKQAVEHPHSYNSDVYEQQRYHTLIHLRKRKKEEEEKEKVSSLTCSLQSSSLL